MKIDVFEKKVVSIFDVKKFLGDILTEADDCLSHINVLDNDIYVDNKNAVLEFLKFADAKLIMVEMRMKVETEQEGVITLGSDSINVAGLLKEICLDITLLDHLSFGPFRYEFRGVDPSIFYKLAKKLGLQFVKK